MKKTLKLIALTLVTAMLLVVAVVPVGADDTASTLSIDYCNLSFRDSVCIKYAVSSASTEETKLLIWDEPSSNYLYGTHIAELETVGNQKINDKTYKIFDYTALSAKQMTDVVYARAYTVIGGEAYYSDVVKYSILQYAYNKLGKTATASSDTKLTNMLSSMLEYGANAQKYFEYSTDRLATNDFYQAKIVGGLIDDLCNHGLYLKGDKVKIAAPKTNDSGIAFSHWENKAGDIVSDTAETTITVGEKNDTYTAVYAKKSVGLEFDSNGDGTCCVVGIGDCTDSDIVIPRKSPNGDTVTSIDSSAFANEPITSVTIPTTVEEIGRKAFNGCDSLKDVYYEGSNEEWNALCDSVGSYNDALLNATVHFAKVTYYTVTFVDYDGTVIATRNVASGEAATAPTDPERAGYKFTGWDKAFNNVTESITVTAQYEKNSITYDRPTIVVESVTVGSDSTVDVALSVAENPGISSLKAFVAYDEKLVLKNVSFTSLFGSLITAPTPYSNPQTISMMSPLTDITDDGVFAILTFDVSALQSGDEADITLTYDQGNTFDINFDNVVFDVANGTVRK